MSAHGHGPIKFILLPKQTNNYFLLILNKYNVQTNTPTSYFYPSWPESGDVIKCPCAAAKRWWFRFECLTPDRVESLTSLTHDWDVNPTQASTFKGIQPQDASISRYEQVFEYISASRYEYRFEAHLQTSTLGGRELGALFLMGQFEIRAQTWRFHCRRKCLPITWGKIIPVKSWD